MNNNIMDKKHVHKIHKYINIKHISFNNSNSKILMDATFGKLPHKYYLLQS